MVAATPFSNAIATGTNGVATSPTAGSAMVFSSTTAGIFYAEVKGDTTAADCNAAAPVYFEWSTTTFPLL